MGFQFSSTQCFHLPKITKIKRIMLCSCLIFSLEVTNLTSFVSLALIWLRFATAFTGLIDNFNFTLFVGFHNSSMVVFMLDFLFRRSFKLFDYLCSFIGIGLIKICHCLLTGLINNFTLLVGSHTSTNAMAHDA